MPCKKCNNSNTDAVGTRNENSVRVDERDICATKIPAGLYPNFHVTTILKSC